MQNSDVLVTDRPFIPPVQQSTSVTGQKQSSSAASKSEVKKATNAEAPGALTATRSVEAPGAVMTTLVRLPVLHLRCSPLARTVPCLQL